MRLASSNSLVLFVAVILALLENFSSVQARKPSRPRGPPARRGPPPPSARRPPSRKRPVAEEEEDEDSYDNDDEDSDDSGLLGRYPGDSEEEEDEYESPQPRRKRPPSAKPSKPSRSAKPAPRRRPPSREYEDDYEDESDDYEERRPSRSSKRGGPPAAGNSRRRPSGPPGRGGRRNDRVVPYGPNGGRGRPGGAGAAATFTKAWAGFTSVMPDPSTVRDGVASSISAARQTTSALSSGIYREVKGLTSSELEQVMLKATRPDDTPVKGKHVERLVGVTYQISARYDIYDAVLRKLWGKMSEKDWRTTIKALYILHRFSSDGAPEHSQALKARLRELRRTKDPKRKDKYFNSKQMLAGEIKPENIKFRAFMARYSHYVLLRAQCFGGVFDEISQKPVAAKPSKKSKAATKTKPITSTNLRVEHLEAATMLLKAGVACQLKEGEGCENTAIAAERVASDLIGLTTAMAIALNRVLKGDSLEGADPTVIRRWCEFYSEECLPKTRAFVKKTSAQLDAYQLFLPSRMGASLSPETLQKGLKADEMAGDAADEVEEEAEAKTEKEEPDEEKEEEEEEEEEMDDKEEEMEEVAKPRAGRDKAADDAAFEDGDEYDEYEYDEEEYYDDEG